MFFKSDNTSIVSPEIMNALVEANQGYAAPYGGDEITLSLKTIYADLFEHDLSIFPVLTGSAANCLALSVITPPYGIIYAHPESHIYTDECGAPGFYTRGAKIHLVEGKEGKIDPENLKKILSEAGFGNVHSSQPAILSLTQATELGTVYTIDELKELSKIAHFYGLPVHMDGARFANALVYLGVSPKEASWAAGIDILSFGATKNGAMAAEAVIFFNQDYVRDFSFRQKNATHLLSKMRYVSIQLKSYIENDLWLKNATHANKMAQQLKKALEATGKAKILYPVDANEIFVELPEDLIEYLMQEGAQFYRWTTEHSTTLRLVTSFTTSDKDIDQFLTLVKSLNYP